MDISVSALSRACRLKTDMMRALTELRMTYKTIRPGVFGKAFRLVEIGQMKTCTAHKDALIQGELRPSRQDKTIR